MCSKELTEKEKMCYELAKAGKSLQIIGAKLGLAVSSVRTYIGRAKAKMKNADSSIPSKEPKAVATSPSTVPEDSKKESVGELRICKTFSEFVSMMSGTKVKSVTLEDRVAEFKSVYCKVCIYPHRCSQCPTKVLMEKYLFS